MGGKNTHKHTHRNMEDGDTADGVRGEGGLGGASDVHVVCIYIRKPHTHTLWKRVGVRGRFPKVAVCGSEVHWT